MPIAKSQMGETVQAGVSTLTTGDGRVKLGGVFKVECFGHGVFTAVCASKRRL